MTEVNALSISAKARFPVRTQCNRAAEAKGAETGENSRRARGFGVPDLQACRELFRLSKKVS
jgi:hypothetical protein